MSEDEEDIPLFYEQQEDEDEDDQPPIAPAKREVAPSPVAVKQGQKKKVKFEEEADEVDLMFKVPSEEEEEEEDDDDDDEEQGKEIINPKKRERQEATTGDKGKEEAEPGDAHLTYEQLEKEYEIWVKKLTVAKGEKDRALAMANIARITGAQQAKQQKTMEQHPVLEPVKLDRAQMEAEIRKLDAVGPPGAIGQSQPPSSSQSSSNVSANANPQKQPTPELVPMPYPTPEYDDKWIAGWIRFGVVCLHVQGEIDMNDHMKRYHREAAKSAAAFFQRYSNCRSNVVAGMKEAFGKSPTMSKMIVPLQKCKLIIHPKGKSLSDQPSGPLMCTWSGKTIPSVDDARACAFIPLTKSRSWKDTPNSNSALNIGAEEDAIAFYVHSRYVDILRALHTFMFFIDYLNVEIEKRYKKQLSTLAIPIDQGKEWTDEVAKVWLEEFSVPEVKKGEKKKKSDKPFPQLIDNSYVQLKECCSAIRKLIGDKYVTAPTAKKITPAPNQGK